MRPYIASMLLFGQPFVARWYISHCNTGYELYVLFICRNLSPGILCEY